LKKRKKERKEEKTKRRLFNKLRFFQAIQCSGKEKKGKIPHRTPRKGKEKKDKERKDKKNKVKGHWLLSMPGWLFRPPGKGKKGGGRQGGKVRVIEKLSRPICGTP